jgi:hypothetical protein
MLKKPENVLETIKRRELDIEIMELELKYGLTKKRAESKLLIMYYKACNVISRTQFAMHEICSHDIKQSSPPSSPDRVKGNVAHEMDP